MDRNGLEAELKITFHLPLLLITFHPVTLTQQSSRQQMQELLNALDATPGVQLVFTMPNADADGRVIIEMIQQYVAQHSGKAFAFTSLGQLRYLSLMKQAAVVVGNSSSGIIEAPGFGVPTVNIGDRQKGRAAAASVIHCATEKEAIVNALHQALNPSFKASCKNIKNPYGRGGTTQKIMAVLREKGTSVNLQKEFVDRI
jgi:UDP-hydrolysing UDP-N-acetyl-D-glucosamine 2-epimerase